MSGDAKRIVLARRARFIARQLSPPTPGPTPRRHHRRASRRSGCQRTPEPAATAARAIRSAIAADMPPDETKRWILARRARFVAAVDAGAVTVDAGVDACGAKPHACPCVCQPGDPLCRCL
jgi:hypothetical protein